MFVFTVQRSSVYISREAGITSTVIEDKNEHLANVA